MSKKHIPSFCEQGRRKMAIDSSKCCLLWSLALNSCMILGYKVENIIIALYFQCELSYIWGRKSLYFHYIGLLCVFFFLSLYNCCWFGQHRKNPTSCLLSSSTVQRGLRGPAFLPGILVECMGPRGPLFVSWCRAVLKSHRTDQQADRQTLVFCP